MADLPFDVTIKDSRKSDCRSRIVRLTPDMAKQNIDQSWWGELRRCEGSEEPQDRHWNWEQLVGVFGIYNTIECVALCTEDNLIQGAMILDLDGDSQLESGKKSPSIERIATRPSNRSRFAQFPEYSGVGKELLAWASRLSYLEGWEGRIILSALPGAVSWYNENGFRQTGQVDHDGLSYLELPKEVAQKGLRKRGYIDG